MTPDRAGLARDLYDIEPGAEVWLRIEGGAGVVGRPSRIDRDEAGIRIELCPHSAEAPQYRLHAQRTPTGWRPPVVERRPLHGEWTRCGDLHEVAVRAPDAPGRSP
jgi:hypothetical protein